VATAAVPKTELHATGKPPPHSGTTVTGNLTKKRRPTEQKMGIKWASSTARRQPVREELRTDQAVLSKQWARGGRRGLATLLAEWPSATWALYRGCNAGPERALVGLSFSGGIVDHFRLPFSFELQAKALRLERGATGAALMASLRLTAPGGPRMCNLHPAVSLVPPEDRCRLP